MGDWLITRKALNHSVNVRNNPGATPLKAVATFKNTIVSLDLGFSARVSQVGSEDAAAEIRKKLHEDVCSMVSWETSAYFMFLALESVRVSISNSPICGSYLCHLVIVDCLHSLESQIKEGCFDPEEYEQSDSVSNGSFLGSCLGGPTPFGSELRLAVSKVTIAATHTYQHGSLFALVAKYFAAVRMTVMSHALKLHGAVFDYNIRTLAIVVYEHQRHFKDTLGRGSSESNTSNSIAASDLHVDSLLQFDDLVVVPSFKEGRQSLIFALGLSLLQFAPNSKRLRDFPSSLIEAINL